MITLEALKMKKKLCFAFILLFLNNRAHAQLPFSLNDCHLGESVFNSFADIKFDLIQKKIIYREFDQKNAQIIPLPDMTCHRLQKQMNCKSENLNMTLIFFDFAKMTTQESQSILTKIRYALGKDTLYANSIAGIFEHPYFDKALNKTLMRTDTIQCVQDRF